MFNSAVTKHQLEAKCIELLEMVRLGRSYLNRFPHEMSGGEQQRVAIARAFATNPSFIVCDEVTSALDVSVQASVVNLLVSLQRRLNTSYLFISHDINIVRQISDYIGVMYLGRFVEIGTIDEIFQPPYHPYTRALLSAVSIPSLNQSPHKVMLEGDIPSAANPPSGCRFHTRCPQKIGAICHEKEPPYKKMVGSHSMACHIPTEELAAMEPVF
jgi:peptide/nickel transport system ATP-binding protein